MKNDIALVATENGIDIQLTEDGSDLLEEKGLETAVLISLFTEQRVPVEELPANETSQKGWWGDTVPDVERDQIGSKLWTKRRAKVTVSTKLLLQETARAALQWMIDDGVAASVDVSASYITPERVKLSIEIQRPSGESERFALVWDGQAAKRG